jgi:hypothetical protein
MKKKISLLYLLATVTTSFAQQEPPDITGLWMGYLQVTDSSGLVKLPFEVAISEDKKKLTGYSRIVFTANGREELGIQNITIKQNGNKVEMEDEGFLEHSFSINPSKRVKKTVNVVVTVTDSLMIMDGEWSTNRTRNYIAMSGKIRLSRKVNFLTSALYQRLDTLKLAPKLSFATPEKILAAVEAGKPKPLLVVAVAPPPAPEPELIIPRLSNATVIALVPISKPVAKPSVKISLPNAAQKQWYARLTTTRLKPPAPVLTAPPKPEPEPVAATVPPKPKPVVAPPKPQPAPVATTPTPIAKPPVVVEKKPEPVVVATKPIPPPAQVVAPSAATGAADLEKRTTKADREAVYFEADSLVLTLYDNGDIDGDTVTVLMNNNVVIAKQGLNTRPNFKTVYISPQTDSVKLVMYAENLGEIPPNTGLLIVRDGEKIYEVRFSADLKTNAAIVLRRRKKD